MEEKEVAMLLNSNFLFYFPQSLIGKGGVQFHFLFVFFFEPNKLSQAG